MLKQSPVSPAPVGVVFGSRPKECSACVAPTPLVITDAEEEGVPSQRWSTVLPRLPRSRLMSRNGEAPGGEDPALSPPGSPCSCTSPLLQDPSVSTPHADRRGGLGAVGVAPNEADASSTRVSMSSTPSPHRPRSRLGSGMAKRCSFGSGRTQKLLLLMLGAAILLYQFVSDHVYIWMVSESKPASGRGVRIRVACPVSASPSCFPLFPLFSPSR
jgi:hypothetical protein